MVCTELPPKPSGLYPSACIDVPPLLGVYAESYGVVFALGRECCIPKSREQSVEAGAGWKAKACLGTLCHAFGDHEPPSEAVGLHPIPALCLAGL